MQLNHLKYWTIAVHESSGQYPEGLIGSLEMSAMGLFDECLAVRAPTGFQGKYCSVFFSTTNVTTGSKDENEDLAFEAGQDGRANWITFYQILQLLNLLSPGSLQPIEPKVSDFPITFSVYFTPSIGFCIPSSCSMEDFRTAVAQLVGSYAANGQSVLTITDDRFCFVDSNDPPDFDGPDIAVL